MTLKKAGQATYWQAYWEELFATCGHSDTPELYSRGNEFNIFFVRDEPPNRLAKMGAMPTPFRAAPAEQLPPPPPEEEDLRSESPLPGTNSTTTLNWILGNGVHLWKSFFKNLTILHFIDCIIVVMSKEMPMIWALHFVFLNSTSGKYCSKSECSS